MTQWEQSLIGTVLTHPDAMIEVDHIMPQDFSFTPHKILWAEALMLAREGALEVRTLANRLAKQLNSEIYSPDNEKVRGEDYINFLLTKAGGQTERYAEYVIEASVRRSLREIGAIIASKAMDENLRVEDIRGDAEVSLLNLRNGRNNDESIPLKDLLLEHTQRIESIRSGVLKPAWVPSIPEWSDIVQFADDDDFVVVAARPGSGKSSVMRYEFFKLAQAGIPVLIINLENSNMEYARYMTSMLTGINSKAIRDPRNLTNRQLEDVRRASHTLAKMPLYVRDLGGPSVGYVVSEIRRNVFKRGIKNVTIDYMQLIVNEKDRKVDDVTYTTQMLRASAKNLKIPHVGIAQMNRAIENRASAEPMLSDLRDSGSIEQDATIVTFIRKDDSTDRAMQFPENIVNGRIRIDPVVAPVKLIVAKHRNGPTGTTPWLKWNMSTNTFSSMERR